MDIKISNKYMDKSEAEILINYIDSNLNKFQSFQDNKYHILTFGKDNHHLSSTNFNIQENRELIIKYFKKTINEIKIKFNDNSDLYISSFWLAKQEDGSNLGLHNDDDQGKNTHFAYSAGIYLNDIFKDGELWFPRLSFTYQPKCGDLVCWPSLGVNNDHAIQKISSDRYAMLMWLTKDPNYSINY